MRRPKQNNVPVDKKYNLTLQAENDLKEIWHYTVDRWNQEQADKYGEQLEQRLQWLAENPMLGRPRNEIKQGYRSFNEGKHLIFYRVVGINKEKTKVMMKK